MTRARDVATQGGLVLINQTTVSTAATIDFTGIFTSTYDNYHIQFKPTAASTNLALYGRQLSGSTPASSTAYSNALVGITSGGSASNYGAYISYMDLLYMTSASPDEASFKLDVITPLANNKTNFFVQCTNSNGSDFYIRNGGYLYNITGSYDGIRFYTNTGTVSGTFRIYGYKKN